MHLAGRTREPLERVAADIAAAGGRAEVAVLDATDERAVDAHADAVAAQAGRIDVSFNLISRGDDQGTPLADMTTDRFLHAITLGVTTAFLTARAAARHMAPRGSGVILHLTSGSSRGTAPGMGNTGPTDAAIEAMMRYLAAELGPQGVRVVGIHTAAVRGDAHAREDGRGDRRRRPGPRGGHRADLGDDDAAPRPGPAADRRDGGVPRVRPRRRDHVRASSTRRADWWRDEHNAARADERDRVRGAGRAPPPRAARPLLPHARLVRGGRGPRAGDAPARVARARLARARRVVPRLGVQDRDERVPRRDQARRAARAVGRLAPRRAVAAALPGPAARGGRPGGRRARRGGRSRARRSSSRSSP